MTPFVLIVVWTFIVLFLWGMSRTMRQVPGPPPWPLRLVMDSTGAPRMSFLFTMLSVSVFLFVLTLATTPSRAAQRQEQLDRIEQMLRELVEKHP